MSLGDSWVDQFIWSGGWLIEEVRHNSWLRSNYGHASNARAQKCVAQWEPEDVFCCLFLGSFFFFFNLSSMFNIWGSNMEIRILAILGLHILLWKMSISLCLTYKVFLVYRALFFCLVPVGVFICSSSFGELNIYNYLTSLEILLRGFLDNFKFKRLFYDIILLWHTSQHPQVYRKKYFHLEFHNLLRMARNNFLFNSRYPSN